MFLETFSLQWEFWKTVATIEGLKVDSRATAHSHSFVLAYSHRSCVRGFDCFTLIGFILPGMHIRSVSAPPPTATFLWIEYDLHHSLSSNKHALCGLMGYWMCGLRNSAKDICLSFAFYDGVYPSGHFRWVRPRKNASVWLMKAGICAPSLQSVCRNRIVFVKVTFLPLTDVMDMSALSMFSCSHRPNPSTANSF